MTKDMKTTMNIFYMAAAAVVAFAGLTSCSDWTSPESVDINSPSVSGQFPELYKQYLQSLRDYKASEHKMVTGWFDNSASFAGGQADRLTALPDSLDAVVLMYPELVDQWEADEMHQIQTQKGTKVLFEIDYASMLDEWEQTSAGNGGDDADVSVGDAPEAGSTDGFLGYMDSCLDRLLPLCAQNGYDGIAVWYDPVNTAHLDDDMKALETARQSAFEARLREWLDANPDMMFFIEGNSMHLISDKSILEDADMLVVRTENEEHISAVMTAVRDLAQEGVPADRFMPMASTVSSSSPSTGYLMTPDGTSVPAIAETAWWVLSPEAYIEKAGLGIYQIQRDYYGNGMDYAMSRAAITILNPSFNN